MRTRRPSRASVGWGSCLFLLAACGGGSGQAGDGGSSSGGTGGGPGAGGGGSGALGAAGTSGGAGGAAVSGAAGVGGAPSGDAGSGAAGSGQAGGRGGTAAGGSGAAGAGGASSSCDDFSCPDLGTCMVMRDASGCTRLCAFDPAYYMARADDVAKLAALRCNVISGSLTAYGKELKSLAGLETIREVTGDLSIESPTALADLGGLSGLEEVAGTILVESIGFNVVSTLASVDLPALKSVGIFAVSSDVSALDTVHDIRLPSLENAGTVFITFNPTLVTVSLDALRTVGMLNISANHELLTLNGLPSLVSANPIQIADNFLLPQCEVSAIVARTGGACVLCSGNDNSGVCP
jgi:hypothetical protein